MADLQFTPKSQPVALTPQFVSTVVVERRQDYSDGLVPGLTLRVTPNGVKTWCLRYRTMSGRATRYTLGSSLALTPQQARLKAKQTLHAIASGQDPAEEKRLQRTGSTWADLAQEYMTKHAKPHKRSWRQDDYLLSRHVLPHWKNLKVTDVARRDVRNLLDRIVNRGSGVTANRVLCLVRAMFNFAIRQDWITVNPASLIAKPVPEVSRDRVLSEDEIRLFWKLCDQENVVIATFLKLRLVTAQRGGELAKLKWSDVTDDWIVIPAGIAKNKRTHRVPLSDMAQTLVAELPRVNEYLFPGRFYGPISATKESGQRINGRMTAIMRQTDPDAEANFRGHDLRRTAATYMAINGVPQLDISRVLNHVEGGPKMTQVYQRYEFDREKRVALETWARVLTGILAGQTTEAVVPFTRSRR